MEKNAQIFIDQKEILLEIEAYYKEKEIKCAESIGNSFLALANRFQEDSLPPASNEVLERISSFEVTDNLKIPSPIQIGYLKPLVSDSAAQINAIVDFILSNGICIELNNGNRTEAHQFLQNFGLKILMSLQAGLANVILMDPEGSGANFKLLLGYEKARPNLILNKSEISTRLADVLKTFNKLQTENLTFKYDNLEELNINEPKLTKAYTFLFISNYPAGFKKEDRELLESIISKGAKFGTFVFMSYDPSINTDWNKTDEIRSLVDNMLLLKQESDGYKIYNGKESAVYNKYYAIELESDFPSNGISIISFLNESVKKSAQKSVDQNEYFGKVLEGKIDIWQEYTGEDDKNLGIKVPVGLKSATEDLEFTFDCGTDNYHAIVGGKTGSGKTVLLDNIIINSCIKYPARELQFVLLDFKGASFQKYKKLPHLRILFGGNDRNYGLNVLRFLNDENTRRQAILANLGGKISALDKAARVKHNFPRMIIILDEFQVLLKEIDAITREANRHIDTIAQQGRSAGMHLILSSQDLTGITISDSAQFNSNVRIALQMDPSACKQIFSMDNIEASILEKKGEAIYNEKPGRPKFGNQRFQVFRLEDAVSVQMVDFFNKHYAIDPESNIDRYFLPNENNAALTNNGRLLQQLSEDGRKVLYPKLFIGEPSFIKVNPKTFEKEDSYVQFKRAENTNVLMAGNDMNAASKILGLMITQLLVQNKDVRFHVLNNFGTDKIEWRERFKLTGANFENNFKYHPKNEVADLLNLTEEEISRRKTDEELCATNFYLIILNLDANFQKQGYNASDLTKKLINILKLGPDLGVHTIVYTYSSKSVSNSGLELDLFETKIALRGDSKDIAKLADQREISKEKMVYLYAPAPVTSINPDLINIYTTCDESKLKDVNPSITLLIKEFLKDFSDDEQE